MKPRTLIAAGLLALVVLAGVAAVSYRLGRRQFMKELAALQEETDRLTAAEKNATIVRRVSQQMEDIAYQQKAISDRQRDRAEEQSLLARQSAVRAEIESRAAHEAEIKATNSAQVAKEERANAELQQKIALEQRDEATHARNVADTLNRRTQARSLAVSSQVRRESDEPEVADLLAYASWYFLKNNRGNQYYSETFKSLVQATGGMARYRMKESGAVNAISQIPGSADQCVAVTNFGEVEWLSAPAGAGSRRVLSKRLLFNPAYDFRDVKVQDGKIYALSLNGPLCILDLQGNLETVSLEEGEEYFKLVPSGNRLLVAGRGSLCWYQEGTVQGRIPLEKPLSALVERNGEFLLFFKDGSYARMDASGNVREDTPLVKGVVTATCYDKETGCLLLGMEDGTVYPVNKYNRVMETMAAHKSRCISITMQDGVVVTGGYDKTAYIWCMDNLLFESGLSFREELEQESVGRRVTHTKEIPTEWLVPVDYTFDGWTLAVCPDGDAKDVWIGTSYGNVFLLNSSADDMARQLYSKLDRNLTQQEWTRYVGVSIPYMTFK